MRHHHVGVAAVLYDKYGRVLLMDRKKEPGAGNLVLVGGTLDEDDPHIGIAREMYEEIGITINAAHFHRIWFAADSHFDQPFLMMYFAAQIVAGSESNMEPHKCNGLQWEPINGLSKLAYRMWPNDMAAVYAANRILGITAAGNQQRIFEGK